MNNLLDPRLPAKTRLSRAVFMSLPRRRASLSRGLLSSASFYGIQAGLASAAVKRFNQKEL